MMLTSKRMIGVLCLSVLLAMPVTELLAEEERPLLVGDTAPNFNLNVMLPKVSGVESVRLRNLMKKGSEGKGTKLIVLSFFATWCKPCMEEMPLLQRLHDDLGKQGVVVLAINVEGLDSRPQKEILESVRAFLKKKKITFPVLFDPFMKDVVARRYLGIAMSLPAIFIMDKNGRILQVYEEKREDLLEQAKKLLETGGK